jgi:hypothetical protein
MSNPVSGSVKGTNLTFLTALVLRALRGGIWGVLGFRVKGATPHVRLRYLTSAKPDCQMGLYPPLAHVHEAKRLSLLYAYYILDTMRPGVLLGASRSGVAPPGKWNLGLAEASPWLADW